MRHEHGEGGGAGAAGATSIDEVLVLTEGSRERSLVERTGGELPEGEEEP